MARKLSLPLQLRWFPCIVAVMLALTACNGSMPPQVSQRSTPTTTTNNAPPAVMAANGSGAQEAPQLAQLVQAGQLPPLAERLPKEPMVVQPVESIGVYGGVWNMGMTGASDDFFLVRTIGYEGLVRWDRQWDQVIPNIAKAWEVSPDGTEIAFFLREGMRWSDGTPFTANDIMFWYEDIILNPELTNEASPGPDWFNRGGAPGTITKVDDYMIIMKFTAPIGLMLQELATDDGADMLIPAHYAKQFHKKYNPEVEQIAANQNLSGWTELFGLNVTSTPAQDARWFTTGRPTLNAWMIETPIGASQQVVAVRNPYYWKVDPNGSQLPYIDRVVYQVAEDPDVLVLKALNGEIDMQTRHISSVNNKSVYFDNQEKGGYGFYEVIPSEMSKMIISFNMNHKDPVLRDIFRDKRFRVALSHAIDRVDISNVAYVGQGEPWQAAPLPQSRYYRESMAKQYTEFDIAKANQILDEIGLQRGADGIRLRPDGQPLRVAAEVLSNSSERIDALQLIKKTWQQVGVQLEINAVEKALFRTRTQAYDYDIATSGGNGGLDVLLDPRFYLPFEGKSYFAIAWADWWNSNGSEGEEPIEIAKQQQALYDQIKITANPEKQDALMNQILDIAEEQFWSIGTISWPPSYGIVKNNFKNVPTTMFEASVWPNPGPTDPEQYYIQP
ncbi:MAG: ABC transporter substrate-binding protein [Chloroflexales bacterium]|nr:ABC transporter substrate-binding protein [Chloroflexales bacterium]